MWSELTFLWNELTILWNDLTIDWNDLTWNDVNDLTMEQNDRLPRHAPSSLPMSKLKSLLQKQFIVTLKVEKVYT